MLFMTVKYRTLLDNTGQNFKVHNAQRTPTRIAEAAAVNTDVQSTGYNTQCRVLYTIQCTLNSVHCKRLTVYTVYCKLFTQCTMMPGVHSPRKGSQQCVKLGHSVRHTVPCTQYHAHSTMHTVPCT